MKARQTIRRGFTAAMAAAIVAVGHGVARGGTTPTAKTWTTQADFEANKVAGGGTTIRAGIDTASSPGEVMLQRNGMPNRFMGDPRRLISSAYGIGMSNLAYNRKNDEYFFIWAENAVIKGERLNRRGTSVGRFTIYKETRNISGLAVAYAPPTNQYLVVVLREDIVCKLVSADGKRMGSLINVNRNVSFSPGAAYNLPSNMFLITWLSEDYVRARLVDQKGALVGGEILVSPKGSAPTGGSAIASSSGDEFMIAWDDQRNGNEDIFLQRLGADGKPRGSEIAFRTGTANEIGPAIAYDSVNNRYLITWLDYRNYNKTKIDLYGQIVGAEGDPVGEEIVLSDMPNTQSAADIAFNADSRQWMVVWNDYRPSDTDSEIYAVPVDEHGVAGSEILVTPSMEKGQLSPRIVSGRSDGECLVTFHSSDRSTRHGEVWTQVMGNGYAARGSITGLKLDAKTPSPVWKKITWTATLPDENVMVTFRTRSAADEPSLAEAVWSDIYPKSGAEITSPRLRWLEVEMVLEWNDGITTPRVQDFTVHYVK